jgi:hypothetical protein
MPWSKLSPAHEENYLAIAEGAIRELLRKPVRLRK